MTVSVDAFQAVSGASRRSGLGRYGKCSSGPSDSVVFDPQTGEVKGDGWSYAAALVERYALQAQAREAMLEAWLHGEDKDKHNLNGKKVNGKKAHAVTRCRRWLQPRGKFEPPTWEVRRHLATGRTFFTGTELCRSPWACPVCSAKVAERRAEEIRKAVDAWIADGGVCLFVTLTVPHQQTDEIAPMVQAFRRALELFRGGRAGKAINEALGRVGVIRAMEVTWGDWHGWHPHSHEIWFCRPGADAGVPIDAIRSRWQDSAQAAGFDRPHDLHGVRIQFAESTQEAAAALADYLTKSGLKSPEDGRPLWGVAEELAKAHSKRGRFRRMTPFDFLRAQYDPQVPDSHKNLFRFLFARYVEAFKGVAQVFWSRGLQARFGIVRRTDAEIAEESRDSSDCLAQRGVADWVRLFARRADERVNVLLVAQNGGADDLRAFLDSLPPPDSS